MAELRTGRCMPCQRKFRTKTAVVYQWAAGRGRELFRAYCGAKGCGAKLQQTTFSNLKEPVVREGAPMFAGDKTCDLCEGKKIVPPNWGDLTGEKCFSCRGTGKRVDHPNRNGRAD
jgi:hypothetical protein